MVRAAQAHEVRVYLGSETQWVIRVSSVTLDMSLGK